MADLATYNFRRAGELAFATHDLDEAIKWADDNGREDRDWQLDDYSLADLHKQVKQRARVARATERDQKRADYRQRERVRAVAKVLADGDHQAVAELLIGGDDG